MVKIQFAACERDSYMDSSNDCMARLDQWLASTLESVDLAEAEVTRLAAESGFQEDEVFKIGMAVREAMVNAVVHGNRYSERKRVHLRVAGDAERFVVRIEDEGDGFDWQSLPDPTAEENILRQSGRGLWLIRSFVDELKIEPSQPKGTALELVKYRR